MTHNACFRFLTYSVAVALSLTPLAAADDVYWIGGPSPETWNDNSNWQVANGSGTGPNFIPTVADGFNDTAIISNGATTTLNEAAQNDIGELRLGREENEISSVFNSGTLEITGDGSLSVVNNGATTGSIFIGRVPSGSSQLGGTNGDAQKGALIVSVNGSLSADGRFFLERRNNADTMLTLQDSASLIVGGDSDLRGVFRMTGPNISYTSNTMQWGGQLRLIPEITGPTHSVINVTGPATLNAGATYP